MERINKYSGYGFFSRIDAQLAGIPDRWIVVGGAALVAGFVFLGLDLVWR